MLRIKDILFVSFLMLSSFLPRVGDARDAAADSVSLWDTVRHSDASLAPEALAAREGWKQVADEKASFAGDACLVNSYLALVLRKGCEGAELYYRLGDKLVKGPNIVPVGAGGDRAKAVESFKIIDVTKDRTILEAGFITESGKKIIARCLLRKDKPFVEVQPRLGTEKVRVEAQSKHAVIPDLFGGDLVVTAQETPSPSLRLPSENMLLQLTDDGNAMVMCVWRSGKQTVRIMLEGEGENRAVSATEIECREDLMQPVWVAVLAAPGIWHQKRVGDLNAVKDTKLDWRVPFQAMWRADFRREDGLMDSWRFAVKSKNGEWDKLKKDGTVWNPARGTFGYPARIIGDEAYLRNIRFEPLKDFKYKADSYVIMYPVQRAGAAPKTVYGAIDVLREAPEEAPEFTLADDVQVKLFPRARYPGACYTTGECEKIFDAKEERQKKKEIVDRLQKMSFFNIVVRDRIEEFQAWQKKIHEFCAKEKAEKPPLAALADEFDGMVAEFDNIYKKKELQERTPAASHVLVEKLIALVDSDDSNKDEEAKLLGRGMRTIAGSQHGAVSEFRMITMDARQRAGYRMMEDKDDASFDFAREMRRRTVEVLQGTLGFEAEGLN